GGCRLEEAASPLRAPLQRSGVLLGAAATVAVLAASALAFALGKTSRPVEQRLVRLTADLGPGSIEGPNLSVAISPDGTRLIYSVRGVDGTQRLATRLLEQSQATVLPGTENSKDPFFSP